MLFKKRIRLKLIVGFLIGVLSIGLFSLYAHNQLDKAKSTIDIQSDIFQSTQSMAMHTKDSFNTLNIYLFTENLTELESLKSQYAVSAYQAKRHLEGLKDKEISLDLLGQLKNFSYENERILQEMIYLHDFKLIEKDEEILKELENNKKKLQSDSQEFQKKCILSSIL